MAANRDDDVILGIVAQRDNTQAQQLAGTLIETLESTDVTVIVDDETAQVLDREGVPAGELGETDLVVSIGGDGTFLYVAREAEGVPLIGVNLGEVGFLNAVSPDDAVETVGELVSSLRAGNEIDSREVDRLQATGEGWELDPALNEIVVHGHQRGHGGGATFEISVDGESYTTSHADGVIVATPTGSTAYNMSEGGPLLRPTLDAIVITQMCATEAMPPLVTDGKSKVRVRVTDAPGGYVISDGRNRVEFEPPATVTISVAADPLVLAGPQVNFFAALNKLE